MIVAVVLARGGSKGIPKKNIQPVNGVPLIVRTVTELLNSSFDRVYVWTDSEEIKAAYEHLILPGRGVDTSVSRPPELSADETTSEQAMKIFIQQVDPKKEWDGVALVQCTTPFLKTKHINQAIEKYDQKIYDSVITAVNVTARYYGYPFYDGAYDFIPMRPYRALRQESGGWKFWMENGGVYLANRSLWMEGRRIGRRCAVVEMDWWESMEIDEPEDLRAAQLLAPMFEEELKK